MEEQGQRNIMSEWEIWMLANSPQSHLITLAWGATINDVRNIRTNEKQTLTDKFKQTEWQKYEITSQESSRWTVCSSESAKLRKFFYSPTFWCVSISICIQHGMITSLRIKTFLSFCISTHVQLLNVCCMSLPRHIRNVTKCFNTVGISYAA